MRREISPLQMLSVWAAGTGVVLAALYFLGLALKADTPDWLPLMITAIGGFELFLFGREHWLRVTAGKDPRG